MQIVTERAPIDADMGRDGGRQRLGDGVRTSCRPPPAEYGGLGLDFSYSMAVSEELGNIRCGGIPMAIGVQTDMATPALAR